MAKIKLCYFGEINHLFVSLTYRSPESLASAHGSRSLSFKDVSRLPAHVALTAVGATLTTLQGGTSIAELDLSDVFGLAAAEHLVAVPLLGVINGPSLAALVAVCAAKHVILVSALTSV